MFTITWTILVLVALVVLLAIALFSSMFKKESGTWSTFIKDFFPNDPKVSGQVDEGSLKYKSTGERTAQDCLEEIFLGRKFTNERPKDIINPNTGRALELDCFNKDLKIAVEYNGPQHYKFIPFYHKTFKDFEDQQIRDAHKELVCKKHGIYLITIPYTTKPDSICSYIKAELKKADLMPKCYKW